MKKLVLVVCLLCFSTITLAQDYWYTVRVQEPNGFYDYYGTVSLSENELIKAISSNKFIHIENLIYFDNQQKIKSWSEWAPYQKPEIYVRGENVMSIQPLVKNPLK